LLKIVDDIYMETLNRVTNFFKRPLADRSEGMGQGRGGVSAATRGQPQFLLS
jgi:hypothetical protein